MTGPPVAGQGQARGALLGVLAALLLCVSVLVRRLRGSGGASLGLGGSEAGLLNARRSLAGVPPLPSGANLDLAKEKLQSVLSLIRNRYELSGPIGSQFMLTANNMEAEAWDLLKYKFALRLLQNNTGDDYLMIFGGSSVTASHDNFYNQSYPATVEKRLGGVFEAMGIKLVVRNIALGANNCIPYQLCYESMGGLDPEFVGWEQSYNCGHDEGVFELAARIAAFSRKRGVVYYSASGAWSPSSCPPSTDKVPYSNEDWTPESAGLPAWKPTAADVQAEKELTDKYAKARASSMRFHPFSNGGSFKSVAPLGFNVWEQNPLCKGRDKDDTKDITNCNGIDGAQGCKLHFMTKEAAAYGSDNGRGANWHPTRAFHMLRGEFISWLWGLTMLDAIYTVEAGLAAGGAGGIEALRKTLQGKLAALQPPLPPPKRCQNFHCEARPVCYTDFRPHFAPNMTLRSLVVGRTNWTYEPEDYQEWSLHYGYLDAKPLYTVQGQRGPLHLRVSITAAGSKSVWLCGNRKEGVKHLEIYVDKNVKLPPVAPTVAGAGAGVAEAPSTPPPYEPSPKAELWTKKTVVGPECMSVNELPVGDHVLSVDTSKAPDKHVHDLSHVITWPG